MYAAEWPCCHDPLRFSPGSEDLLRFARNNPPLQPPARSSSQTQPCVVVAPELQATHHHLPGAPKQRGSLRLLPCALRRGASTPRAQAGRPRPARTPLLCQAPRPMCVALHRPNLVVTFLPLPRGQSHHPSNHTRSPLAYSLTHSLTHPPYKQHATEYCQCVDSCHTHTPSMRVAQCQECLE